MWDSLFDNPFNGIHHLVFFDWAILIPYFSVLLCSFLLRAASLRDDPRLLEASQDVFRRRPRSALPSCRASRSSFRFITSATSWNGCCEETAKIDYPRHLLQIQVLDDSTDDTHPFTERLVAEYQAAGLPIEYIHRTNRHGYKAGALQNGSEDRDRRDRRDFRRRFRSAGRFSAAHGPFLHRCRRSAWCRRAGLI